MKKGQRRRKIAEPRRAGPPGLTALGGYRLSFSEDVKRRRQQKRENRRTHRVRGAVPGSVLGNPELHWAGPPAPERGIAGVLEATPKHRAEPSHGRGVLGGRRLFAGRGPHRSRRPSKNRP